VGHNSKLVVAEVLVTDIMFAVAMICITCRCCW